MSIRKVDFIDREREIQFLLSAIYAWDTQQAIFLYGEAGVGKTSIIKKSIERFNSNIQQLQSSSNNSRFWIFYIDLDDFRLQSSDAISFFIIKQIGMWEAFERYVREFQVLKQIEEREKVTPSKHVLRVEKAFVECYREVSHGMRTVIFCDTTDAAKTSPAKSSLEYLDRLCSQINNTIIIFAGRDADEWCKDLQLLPKSNEVQHVPEFIKPLSERDSLQYLIRKQKLLNIVIEPDIKEKILFFAKGVPFIIDLAAEWRAREIPLSWLIELDIDSISDEDIEKARHNFEAQLVRHIKQLRRPLDQLSLVLSWIYPIDMEFCARLLDLSEKQAEELIADAQRNIPFIKTLPDAQIKLHDYMEEMVQKYVWPEMEEERKQRDSRRAAQYLENKTRELMDNYETSGIDSDPDIYSFLERESLLREYWQISIQAMRHALYSDVDLAERIFSELVNKLSQHEYAPVRDEVLKLGRQLTSQLQQLNTDDWFEVSLEYSYFLGDQLAQYSESESILVEMIESEGISDSQRIRALIARGNLKTRLADADSLGRGLDDFLEAIKIAQDNNLKSELGRAELEAGWTYSNIGDWGNAIEHFYKALELALESGNQELEATVLNELAYIKFYEDAETAISICEDSIEMWIDIGDKFGLGRAYSNMGTLYYRSGKFIRAQEYFQRSMDIFRPAENLEWIGILSSWQGITFCAQAEINIDDPEAHNLLQKAESLIMDGLKANIPFEKARNLNRIARVYRLQKRYDKVWEYLQEAYDASLGIPDTVYEAASIRDLASLSLELGRFDSFDDLKEKLSKYEARGIRHYSHAYGGTLIYIGIMGIYLGDIVWGSEKIAEGLKTSAESGRYANHTFNSTLQEFRKLVEELVAPSEKRELANYLRQYWDKESLNRKYIEATRLFYKL
jgi:tetratricopeptide (TPR) repeat protein